MFGVAAKADVWHCFYQGSPYWPKSKNTKVVLTVHDLNFTIKYSGWKRTRETVYIQKHVERADAIVAISEFTKGEILRHLKVDSKKIAVIYNGVTTPNIAEKKPSYLKDEKFFFCIGIISEKKNFHVVLPLLKHFQINLVIAGNNSGSYAKRIAEESKRLGISERVIMPGEISEEEKLWLYKNCEAFLFPSLTEGFGLPVVEAMSQGKPVFCSNLTSLPEIGGSHAYYFTDFDPEHMISTVISGMKDFQNNPAKMELVKEWSKQFSWEEAAQKYLRLYASLAD